jgi:hypothetical protein
MRRFILWFVAWVVVAILVLAPSALASTSGGPSGSRSFDLVLNSWPVILAAFTGFLSSQVTALFTHHRAPQWVKSLTNLLLTTLGGVLITVQTVPGHTWKDYVGEILMAWVVSLLTHFSGMTALVQSLSSNFGFGAGVQPLVAPSGTTVTSTGDGSTTSSLP